MLLIDRAILHFRFNAPNRNAVTREQHVRIDPHRMQLRVCRVIPDVVVLQFVFCRQERNAFSLFDRVVPAAHWTASRRLLFGRIGSEPIATSRRCRKMLSQAPTSTQPATLPRVRPGVPAVKRFREGHDFSRATKTRRSGFSHWGWLFHPALKMFGSPQHPGCKGRIFHLLSNPANGLSKSNPNNRDFPRSPRRK